MIDIESYIDMKTIRLIYPQWHGGYIAVGFRDPAAGTV